MLSSPILPSPTTIESIAADIAVAKKIPFKPVDVINFRKDVSVIGAPVCDRL
jgi:hypothetical protein